MNKKQDTSLMLKELENKKPEYKSVTKQRYWFQSLSVKLYGGLIVFISCILLISIFSWRSLREVVSVQQTLMTKNVPDLVLLNTIVQQSERLIKSAPQLITSSSKIELNKVKKEIEGGQKKLKTLMNEFKKSRNVKYFAEVLTLVAQIAQNLEKMETPVIQKRELMILIQDIFYQITQLTSELNKTILVEIDDRTFDLALKSKSIKSVKEVNESIELKDILDYRQLLNLQSQTNIAVNLLREAVGLSNADRIQPLRERFIAAIEACEQHANLFANKFEHIKANITKLREAGLNDKKGIFYIKKKVLDIEKLQSQFLKENKIIANQLSEKIRLINYNIHSESSITNNFFKKSLKKNQNVLLVINFLGVFASIALALFFIGPLIQRLSYLARRMKAMVVDNSRSLEKPIIIKGSDEVRQMGDALEIFRQYVLELKRLNLVEKLAKEIQEKNIELERTIQDLHKTRNQLVIQEKLASLGQLTSGIAHEIKNPLNFINNFSKLSKDIVEDLKTELNKPELQVPKEVQELITELTNDLQSNMNKIHTHGERANDIIIGMLQHSRGEAGQEEQVNINKYMDIYSNLAFHSKRSASSAFNLVFDKQYDISLEPITIIPQDVSRIILNIVTNACDAIQEKIQKYNIESYKPCIVLKTKKIADQVQICIRDNGLGIPDSVKEKIFNPFFTTKDTGHGTGLGLSLVHDIVTKHGGVVKVESQEGEFTEFIITLPIKTPHTGAA